MTNALARLADAVEAGTATHSDFVADGLPEWIAARIAAWNAYNGSLDAAKALHEAVLPGCTWFIESAYRGDAPTAAIEGHGISVDASNDNPARAWLIAIIRALIADTEGR